jgi:hypothetical protein
VRIVDRRRIFQVTTKLMKITFANIVDLSPNTQPSPSASLVKILTASYERGAIPLSKITCDLARAMKSVDEHFKAFEDARGKIVAAFDDEDKETNKERGDGESLADWRKDAEKLVEFNDEFNSLLQTEIDLHVTPQPEALIDQAKGLEWAAQDRLRLDWFFEQAAEESTQPARVSQIAEGRKKKAKAA